MPKAKAKAGSKAKAKAKSQATARLLPCLVCVVEIFFWELRKFFFPVMMFFLKIGWEFQDVSALVCKCRLD